MEHLLTLCALLVFMCIAVMRRVHIICSIQLPVRTHAALYNRKELRHRFWQLWMARKNKRER